MAHDLQWLKLFVYSRTVETWAATRQPYTLCTLGADLHKHPVDYKPLIAPRAKLSAWAEADGVHGLRFLKPPAAKLAGFVPSPPALAKQPSKPGAAVSPGEARLLELMRSLALFSDPELDGMQMPLRVLVRMLDR